MTKHTPGPWEYIGTDNVSGYAMVVSSHDSKRGAIAMVDGAEGEDGDVQRANAFLVSAAPDLLAACENAEFLLRKLSINWKEAHSLVDSAKRGAEEARDAIKKARGE